MTAAVMDTGRVRPDDGIVTAAASGPDGPAAVSVEDRDAWVVEQLRAVDPWVRRVCVRQLGDADGQDAAQQVLLSLWLARDRLRPDPTGGMWAYAAVVMRRQIAQTGRELARGRTVSADVAGAEVPADPAQSPEERVLQAEADQLAGELGPLVHRLIGQLPARRAAIVTALWLHGRSRAEVATEHGVSVPTVGNEQTMARHRIKPQLMAAGYQPPAVYRSTHGRRCGIDGCGRTHHGRDLCATHWWRRRTYGDPLRLAGSADGRRRNPEPVPTGAGVA